MVNIKELIFSLVWFILFLVPWLFPDIKIHWKIAITLFGIIISLLISLFFLYGGFVKQRKELNKIKINHRALALQFAEKQRVIYEYEKASFAIRAILGVAISKTKNSKISAIAEAIYFELKQANDRGVQNEKANQSSQDY